MKKFITFITVCAIMLQCTAINVFAANTVNIEILNYKQLNILKDEPVSLDCKMSKTESGILKFYAKCTVKDVYDNVVWTQTTDVIRMNAYYNVSFNPTGLPYGANVATIEALDNPTDGNVIGQAQANITVSKKANILKNNFGIASHFVFGIDADTMPMIKNMGAAFIRDEIEWSDYEKTKGSYVLPEYADNYIKKAVENGIEPVIILGYNNKLYSDNTRALPNTSEQLQAYGNYVRHLVADLKGKVKYFSVWNEPSISNYSDAEAYVKVLKTAYENAKAVNEDCKIVGLTTAGTYRPMMENLANAGAGQYMDIVSFQQYVKTDEDQRRIEPEKMTWTAGGANTIHDLYGADKEAWLTEMGWSTYDNDGNVIGERAEAMYSVRAILWNDKQTTGHADKMFFYTWVDHGANDGSNFKNWECNLGILKSNYNAKAVYSAYANMTATLKNATFKSFTQNGDNYIYSYKNGEHEDITVAYNVYDNAGSVQVSATHKNNKAFDMYGNEIALGDAQEGKYTINVNGAPVYFVSYDDEVIMNYETNNVKIYGQVAGAKAGEQVMIYVFKPGKDASDVLQNGALAYVDQFTLNNDGMYDFSFPASQQSGQYKIYLGYKSGIIGPALLDIERMLKGSAAIYNGDNPTTSLSELAQSGNSTFKAEAVIDNLTGTQDGAIFYAAGFKNGQLGWVLSDEADSFEKKADNKLSVFVTKQLVIDSDEIKLYIWTDNQQPILANPTEIK